MLNGEEERKGIMRREMQALNFYLFEGVLIFKLANTISIFTYNPAISRARQYNISGHYCRLAFPSARLLASRSGYWSFLNCRFQ